MNQEIDIQEKETLKKCCECYAAYLESHPEDPTGVFLRENRCGKCSLSEELRRRDNPAYRGRVSGWKGRRPW